MSSPFAGCWQLYGRENVDVLADTLALPLHFRNAMKNVRVCEEIHVNGDHVHMNVHVPTYCIPAHGKDVNFTFGVEHTQSLPFGRQGKGTATKESETKWTGKFTHPDGHANLTREIKNDEMWVTIEGRDGVKCVRKFERCVESCGAGPVACPGQKAGCSPFQGCWRLYGSDNFDKFMESIGVPLHWRCIFGNTCVTESIHVNGNDVHIKIHLPEILVPAHQHEFSFKFGEPHEIHLPFGHTATASGSKVSETKWQAKLTNSITLGEAQLTREIVGNEMWTVLEAKGKRIVHKFTKCAPCGQGQGSCTTTCK